MDGLTPGLTTGDLDRGVVDEFGSVDMREYLSPARFVGMTVWINRRDETDVQSDLAESTRGLSTQG